MPGTRPSMTKLCRRLRRQIIEFAFLPELARERALHLAARCLRQALRPDQHDVAREYLMLIGNRLTDDAGVLVRVDAVACGALNFLPNDQLFSERIIWHRKRRPAVLAQSRMCAFHGE